MQLIPNPTSMQFWQVVYECKQCALVLVLISEFHQVKLTYMVARGIVKEEYLVIILVYFFLLLYKNICCGYSLEVPHWCTSNECPKHIFLWQTGENYSIIITKYSSLTLKTPRKSASENVVCFSRLLNILANFSNLFLHTGKQCGSRSDCSFKVISRRQSRRQ